MQEYQSKDENNIKIRYKRTIQSIDEEEFFFGDEGLYQNFENQDLNAYTTTNLIYQHDLKVNEIEIIDPRIAVKDLQERGVDSSMFSNEEIKHYGFKTIKLFLSYNKEKQNNTKKNICETSIDFNLLQRKVDDYHKISNITSPIERLKSKNLFLSKKKKKKFLIQEKNKKFTINKYKKAWKLLNQEQFSYQEVQNLLKLSLFSLRRIKKYETIESITFPLKKRKNPRFHKFHERAKNVILQYIKNSTHCIQAADIQECLLKETSLRTSLSTLKNYMKEELCLSYKIIRPITSIHNRIENKLQRQFAAGKYIDCLMQDKLIINIDETIIAQTDNRKRGWAYFWQHNIESHSQRLSQVNMIAAVSNRGDVYYTLNQGKTNGKTFLLFVLKLITQLEQIDQDWRSKVILIIDNAPYHRGKIIRQEFESLNLPIMFLGPYQFKLAPVEQFFSFLKNRDLNPLNIRAYSKGYIPTYFKELCMHISKLDFSWCRNIFYYLLTHALEFLCLQDI